MRYVAGRLALAACGLMIVGWTGSTAGPAAGPPAAPGRPSSQILLGVAAISRSDAWAVGTVIEHWDGRKWSIWPMPRTGCAPELTSVTATGPAAAWAVGTCTAKSGIEKPLIVRWAGRRWQVEASPGVPGKPFVELTGVAATSRSNAWAVGLTETASHREGAVIEHWNGKAWRVQANPAIGGRQAELRSVSATSAGNAWAVGGLGPNGAAQTLIERWNGRSWRVQPSFSPGSGANVLFGISAVSHASAFTAGVYGTGIAGAGHTLVENWNGGGWLVQSTEDPATSNLLTGIAARTGSDAWAVGYQSPDPGHVDTLILRWNGTSWKIQASPTGAAPGLAVRRGHPSGDLGS